MIASWIKRTVFWRLLQQFRHNLSLFFIFKHVVEHSYCGLKLKVAIEDPLAKGWYDHDWPMLGEIRLLSQRRLKPGALVFDLGGHQGVVAMVLARCVGETGKVITAEPNLHNFDLIRKNLELNKISNVTPLRIAIGDAEGSLEFSSGLNGTAAKVSKYGVTQVVPMTTIDQLVKSHGNPQVVFLDIEGFEALALGAGKTAFNRECDFFVEIHVQTGLEAAGNKYSDVLDYFPDDQFDRFVHHDDGKEPIRIEDAPEGFFEERFFLTALAK